MPGHAREEDLFDGVVAPVDLAVNDWRERLLRRHGPQAGGDEHALADDAGLLLPSFLGPGGRPVVIVIAQEPQTPVARVITDIRPRVVDESLLRTWPRRLRCGAL